MSRKPMPYASGKPAPDWLVACRTAAECAAGAGPYLWERTYAGNLLKGANNLFCAQRARVWRIMRERFGLSYPRIAWACSMTTHSTIREALCGSKPRPAVLAAMEEGT